MAFGRTMEKLYKKFIDDLSEGCQGDDPIIVYTATEQISMVKACYAYLACEADENESLNKLNRQLLVYDIQYLFYALKKAALSITGRPSDDITLQVTSTSFQGDYFDYTAGIACDYHEEIDSTKYCTRNMVIRWCYIFSDFICGDLDIQLKPGKHIPAVTEPSYNITLGEPEEIFYDCVSDCSWYAGDEGSNLDCDPPQGHANLWDDIPGMEQLSIQEISDEKWSIN
ncbi:protein maelstrom-like [Drosophila obscura]|uniref:protein maelstrom-like n=1 Tax=Drosophila obscura TaxID=7282 RepID=UPI001BB247CA|nr:protein maelstrom-like [Drosophila obscura]